MLRPFLWAFVLSTVVGNSNIRADQSVLNHQIAIARNQFLRVLKWVSLYHYEAFLALVIVCEVKSTEQYNTTIIPFMHIFRSLNMVDKDDAILQRVKDLVQSSVELIKTECGEFYYSVVMPK